MINGEGGVPVPWNGDKWQYLQLVADGDLTAQGVLQTLGQLGQEGWELCATLTINGNPALIFKRLESKGPRIAIANMAGLRGL